jgi:hypothetical protein
LLVLARLESGVQELERTPVDLTTLVHAVAADADFEATLTATFRSRHACQMIAPPSRPVLVRSAL